MTLASALLVGAMASYGCGDDDARPGPSAPDSGVDTDAGLTSETSSGSTDTETDDSDTETINGVDTETGTTDEPTDDAGADAGVDAGPDSGTEPVAPEAGADAGDSGTDDTTTEPGSELGSVQAVTDGLFTFANDLRGLTYNADGSKFYASGYVDSESLPGDRQTVVARFNADGTLDEAFGVDGVVTHNLVEREASDGGVVNDGDEQSLSLLELANGQLVVQVNVRDAAGLGTDIVLLKLNAAGERVTEFGDDGVLRVDLGWAPEDDGSWPNADAAPVDNSWDIKLDTSSGTEKIVVFGHGPPPPVVEGTQRVDNDRYILRLLAADGSFDPDFNEGNPYTLNTGGTFSDGSRRGHVNEDGSILSAGYTNYGAGLNNHMVNIRLLADGTPDPAFGFGLPGVHGVVVTNPFVDDGGMAECYTFLQQSNGRYVTTGYGEATAVGGQSSFGWASTEHRDLVSAGFTARRLDPSYGTQGALAIQSEDLPGFTSKEDRGRDIVILEDDRVVHVGRFGDNPAIFVTLPDGELDLSSGVDGRFSYEPLVGAGDPPAPTSHFFKVALSPDGKSIAATTSSHESGVRVAVLQVVAE